MDDSIIPLAEQYVTQTHQIVASQRDRVERLRGAGYDTSDAEQTLRVFEKSLRTFEDYRDWLRNHGAHFWPSSAVRTGATGKRATRKSPGA
jgi:uncharacterized protein Smg (DUF494 family)